MSSHDTGQPLMTISDFARRSGLSHKALRLYDESGLLHPVSVDPSTGYRRYSVEQFARARRIGLLRQLDMPLALIAELLDSDGRDGGASPARLLDRWWAGQEATMRAKRGTLDYLYKRLVLDAEAPGRQYAVALRDVPEMKVACIRRDVTQQDLVGAMSDAADRIQEHLLASGVERDPVQTVIFHGLVGPDSEAPIEVCIGFTGTVEPVGPIAIRIEPARTEAFCTVNRDDCFYPRIMDAYAAVEDWIRSEGLEAGVHRESYFAAWDAIGPNDPFMNVTQTVKGKIHV